MVTLWDGIVRGSAARAVRTDVEGMYTFEGVVAGLYQLGVQLPEGYGVPSIQWQNVDVNGGSVSVPPIPAPRIHWRLYAPHVVR